VNEVKAKARELAKALTESEGGLEVLELLLFWAIKRWGKEPFQKMLDRVDETC
jgi:hypothetical protein